MKISVPSVMGMAAPAAPYAGPLRVAGQNMFGWIGFFLLAPFLFFLFSRLLDVTIPQLHLPLILGVLTLVCVLLSGEIGTVLQMTPMKWFILFTAWFCLASVFGMWKGGSYQVFRDYWTKSVVILVAIPCLAITQGRIRLLIRILMIALMVAMLVALAGGETDREGRLIMSGGEFANSNMMGMFGVIGLLLCWYSATCPGHRRLTAIGSVAAMVPMFQVVSHSGSRTALVMLMVLGLYLLYRSIWKEKVLVVGVMVLGALFSFLTTPETMLKRFSTLFVTSAGTLDPDSLEVEASAVGSTETRIHHLKMSLLVTIQHPLLGVGPGQFMEAENLLMQKEGRRGTWQFSHNGFTEISSETGVPGLVFYSAALVWIWNAMGRLSDRAARVARFEEVHHIAAMFRTLFLVTAVGVFFGISLYHYFVPAFIGLALGFLRSSNANFAAAAKPRTQ